MARSRNRGAFDEANDSQATVRRIPIASGTGDCEPVRLAYPTISVSSFDFGQRPCSCDSTRCRPPTDHYSFSRNYSGTGHVAQPLPPGADGYPTKVRAATAFAPNPRRRPESEAYGQSLWCSPVPLVPSCPSFDSRHLRLPDTSAPTPQTRNNIGSRDGFLACAGVPRRRRILNPGRRVNSVARAYHACLAPFKPGSGVVIFTTMKPADLDLDVANLIASHWCGLPANPTVHILTFPIRLKGG